MSPQGLAADDIVRTRAELASGGREPLVVLEPLAAFLAAHGIGSGTPELSPIGEGHSNPTFALRAGDAHLVLRRPPRGPLPPSAHDVLREARVLRALAGHAPVPEVRAVCDDAGVIGAPFYVMERVPGDVITEVLPPRFDAAEARRAIGEALVDALVAVHALDWRASGLEGFGRPEGYLQRQLRRFKGLWEANRTRDIPAVAAVAEWLGAHVPESPPATVVHGDYRLGNVIWAPEGPPRVAAILDWEMSTIGDPLADLGYLCLFWVQADDPDNVLTHGYGLTRAPGFQSREELVARYEERSGRAMRAVRWYRVLALWKLIVFMEGNYRRALAGSTDDPHLKRFGSGIADLADHALELVRG
jgi:aminoglycoside phosphotransferase (APT) family kinase protein